MGSDKMRIVVDVAHPANVHLFKNFIKKMQKRGHEILITASQKEVSLQLLNAYGLSYIDLGSYGDSLLTKAINIPKMDYKMYNVVKDFNPDIFLGPGSIRSAHVSKLLGKPCISVTGTEHAEAEQLLYLPFTDCVVTSTAFRKDFGKKHVRFNSYFELAYLHPNYFKPDPRVLEEVGLSKNEQFIIVRFISWKAAHDRGHRGIKDKTNIIKRLEEYGRVFVTSEAELDNSLRNYMITISPEKLHDLLFYSRLCFGEGATIPSEAALLGTPSISISTLEFPGFMYDEAQHGLVYLFSDPKNAEEKAIQKAVELLETRDLKSEALKKRDNMLKNKIDPTAFLVWFVEEYPKSFLIMRSNPEIQNRFL